MSVDVAVVGGGPVGCVAALCHAQAGARVALLEAAPKAVGRLAGELLHPPAVQALERVGVDLSDAPEVRGFVVYSAQEPAPVKLCYPGSLGRTFPFDELVWRIRRVAAHHPLIDWMPGTRASVVGTGTLELKERHGHRTLAAGRIVGADGRNGRDS
jgi:squalene monooxygenase